MISSRRSLFMCIGPLTVALAGGCSGENGFTHPGPAGANAAGGAPAAQDSSSQLHALRPASVVAWPGASCIVKDPQTDSNEPIQLFADDFDGVVRFSAARAPLGGTESPLTMECQDETGRHESYRLDPGSDELFQERPVTDSPARFDRPALAGDPLSYSAAELVKAGFGLRPPVTEKSAYAAWLARATRPAQMVRSKKLIKKVNFGTFDLQPPGGGWAGAVMNGNGPYIWSGGTIQGVDQSTISGSQLQMKVAAWNGIGGLNNLQLIQSGVAYEARPFFFTTISNQYVWREFCCGEGTTDQNGKQTNGVIDAFFDLPSGHSVFAENWTCDRDGSLDPNGGLFGCSFIEDEATGQAVSCVSPTDPKCPSLINPTGGAPIVLPFSGGTTAEFIVEPLAAVPHFSSGLLMTGSFAVNSSFNGFNFGTDSGLLFQTQGIAPSITDTTVSFSFP